MKTVTKPCEICGTPFKRPKGISEGRWAARRFCSRRCSATRVGRFALDAPSAKATWTETEFRTAVAQAGTIAEAARILHVGRHTVAKWIDRWNLDTSHFSGYGHVADTVRFWRKVDQTEPAGCWTWTDTLNHDGYGRFTVDGAKVMAHRYAYETDIGPVPAGLELDHLCRNRACVNPAHLEPVTHTENVRRAVAA